MSKLQKPGEKPAKSGEYIERKRTGQPVRKPRQVTMETGDSPLPPTQERDHRWERIGPVKK